MEPHEIAGVVKPENQQKRRCPNPRCDGKETFETECPVCGMPLSDIEVFFPTPVTHIKTIFITLAGLTVFFAYILSLNIVPFYHPIYLVTVMVFIACYREAWETYKGRFQSVIAVFNPEGNPESQTIWIFPVHPKKPSVKIPFTEIKSIHVGSRFQPYIFPRDDPFVNIHIEVQGGETHSIMTERFREKMELRAYFKSLVFTMHRLSDDENHYFR
jgi:hypothetical protein